MSHIPLPDGADAPWTRDDVRPLKPFGATEYGYVDASGVHGCSRVGLYGRCTQPTLPDAVWTPESPWLHAPAELPWLHDALRAGARHGDTGRVARWVLGIGAVLVAVLLVLGLDLWIVGFAAGTIVLAVATLALVARHHRRQRLAALTPDAARREAEDVRVGSWLARQQAPLTEALVIGIGVVGLAQLLTGGVDRSVEAAGLLPDTFARGEPWRLLTGALLHGGFVHFWMNAGALRAIGRYVEALGHRAHLAIVFVAAAIGGNVVSLLAPPAVAGVGASGGILGLVGYLLVLAKRRPRHAPPRLARAMWMTILLTGALGLVLFMFIDNAAHVGGLLTGVLVAIPLLVRQGDERGRVVPGAVTRALAYVAEGTLVLAALVAVAAMLRGIAG